ncbi:MAG: terminase small subunit [Roseiarcus sp.]
MLRNKPKRGTIDPKRPLPVATRELFAQWIAQGVNVQVAYERAGYTGNAVSRHNMRRSPDVEARVNWLLQERIDADTRARHKAEKPIADLRLRVLKELERVAFADARDLVQWDREPILDGAGNVRGYRDVMVTTPSRRLTRDQAASVRSVTTKSGALKIDVHDKLNALMQLSKALGLYQDAAPPPVTVNQVNVSAGQNTGLELARRLAFALSAARAIAPPKELPAASEPLTVECAASTDSQSAGPKS